MMNGLSSAPNQSEILSRLQRAILGRVPVDPTLLSPTAKLTDIGIDSFSLIELIFLVEEEFGITINFDQFSVNTVGDVLEIIAGRIGKVGAA
jgi:acyl carrier protein